ncbi:Ltp family lipoprotein [Moraxella nasicaprae]|uniref:Ltp family lipoprotein n=1 Tax=Moraxella nasicaprae TaxID=2904122 RepID=A0ABY6F4N5_9GAMM|nr:Ltp family lipoprotein [Moraxella nasicaprae]UXZ05050.1 Ltp family lipoprotein [Moraxella nasicaprae]
MKKFFKFVFYAIIALIAFGFVTAMLGDNKPKTDTAKSEPVAEAKADATEVTKPEELTLTASQKNAVRSAENYLDFKGFSRDGLIAQLSSEYGDGYSKKDATVAVDSLDVDWNEQAVIAAKNYLEFKGFSCKGLVDQLSSKHGDKFTKEQAEYGAKGAGACN